MTEEMNDGNYYLKELDASIARLKELSINTTKGLACCSNEELIGSLRVATGQANLLISKKGEQFRELCWKNIRPEENEKHPTTNDDLAGFWDMVMIQVTDLEAKFESLSKHIKKKLNKKVAPNEKTESRPNQSGQTELGDSHQTAGFSGQKTKITSQMGKEGVFYRRIARPAPVNKRSLAYNLTLACNQLGITDDHHLPSYSQIDLEDSHQTTGMRRNQSRNAREYGKGETLDKKSTKPHSVIERRNKSPKNKRVVPNEQTELDDSHQTPGFSGHKSKIVSQMGKEGVFCRRIAQPAPVNKRSLAYNLMLACNQLGISDDHHQPTCSQNQLGDSHQTTLISRIQSRNAREYVKDETPNRKSTKQHPVVDRRNKSPKNKLRVSDDYQHIANPQNELEESCWTAKNDGVFCRRITHPDALNDKRNKSLLHNLTAACNRLMTSDDDQLLLKAQNESQESCRTYIMSGYHPKSTKRKDKVMASDDYQLLINPDNELRDSHQTRAHNKNTSGFEKERLFFRRITSPDRMNYRRNKTPKNELMVSDNHPKLINPQKELGDCHQTPGISGHHSKNTSQSRKPRVCCRKSTQMNNRRNESPQSDSTDLYKPISKEIKALIASHVNAKQRSQRRIDRLRLHNISHETYVVEPNPFTPEKTITSLECTTSGHMILSSNEIVNSPKSKNKIAHVKDVHQPKQSLKHRASPTNQYCRTSNKARRHASPNARNKQNKRKKCTITRPISEPFMKSNGHYINPNHNENAYWHEESFSEESSD